MVASITTFIQDPAYILLGLTLVFKVRRKTRQMLKILKLKIMKLRHLQRLAALALMGVLVTVSSCKKNLTPAGAVTTASVYKDFNNYIQVVGKLYTAFAISGQSGGAGTPDIAGIDEG